MLGLCCGGGGSTLQKLVVFLAPGEEELAVHSGLVLVKNMDVIRSSETSRAAAGRVKQHT